jgi:hypothetical protein
MVARSSDGKIIAHFEIVQTVQGDEVTMRLIYHFLDGSIDEETTTYSQQETFRLVRNHHVQKGPFFTKPVDFAVDATTGMATNNTVDRNGKAHTESEHLDLPDDVANGFIGTLLLNVSTTRAPFSCGALDPVRRWTTGQTADLPGKRAIFPRGRPALQGDFVSHPSRVGGRLLASLHN